MHLRICECSETSKLSVSDVRSKQRMHDSTRADHFTTNTMHTMASVTGRQLLTVYRNIIHTEKHFWVTTLKALWNSLVFLGLTLCCTH